MTRLVRRFARLLFVAGGCSIASLSLANSYAPQAHEMVAAMNVNPDQARLEAIKVEVALIGDPVTMRLQLSVGMDQAGIVLRGTVPDAAARQRVLEVARQSSYLPIHDALTVSGGRPGIDGVTLKKGARDLLVRQLGSKADRFVLTTTDDGQLKVDGEVASVDEKLQVSRTLRGLSGCSRIVNCLTVRSHPLASHTITVVASNGLDTPLPTLAPARFEPATMTGQVQPAQYTSTTPILPPTSSSTLPPPRISSPTARFVSVSGSPPTNQGSRPQVYAPPTVAADGPVPSTPPSSPGYPGCNCQQKGIQLAEAQGAHKPSIWEKLTAWKGSRARRQPPVAPPTAQMAPQYTAPISATPVAPVAPTYSTREEKGGVSARPVSRFQQLLGTKPRPAEAAPAGAPAILTPGSTAEPPLTDSAPALPPPAILTTPPQQTSGNYQGTYRPQSGAAAANSNASHSRPLAALASQAPSRVVPSKLPPPRSMPMLTSVSPDPIPLPVLQPTSAPDLRSQPILPASMRPDTVRRDLAAPPPIRLTERELVRRVRDACGKMASDVRVEMALDRTVMVHVHALPATEHLLVARLLHVPELAARNVQLHVHLAN